MRSRRLAVALATLLALAGCSTRDAVAPPPETTALPATATPGPLQWSDCGDDLECSTLAVPLDYREPTGPQIQLAVARRPSTSEDPIGSLVVNPGGPGGSGIEFIRDGGAAGLDDAFDIVSWDPRGVGDSRPLACARSESFFDLDPSPDDPAEQTALEGTARAIADECEAADAMLLPTLRTDTAADDLEQLRLALGGEPLNYFGFSYGTHIGLDYAARFPDHVRAMVLDGVVDPSESLTEFLTGQAVAVEQALASVIDEYRQLAARLEIAPIRARDGEEVGPGLLGVAAVEAIYAPRDVRRLRRAMSDGLAGDGTALADLAHEYLDGSSFAGYLGVLCTDSPHPAAGDEWWQFIEEITAAAPDFGAGVGNEVLPCAYWPGSPTEPAGPETWPPGSPPILLVAATGDAATPIDDAERVQARLPHSVLLVRDGDGHTSYAFSTCVTDAVQAYLVDLQLPARGTVCPS